MYSDSSAEACPISEELFGDIYRAGPDGIEGAVANLPQTARARLAAFCYARTHLQEIGLAVAATCDERSLTEAAGRAGEALYDRSRKRANAAAPSRTPNKRAISLAKLAPIRPWTVIQGGLAELEDAEPADLPAVQCSAMAGDTPVEVEDFEDASEEFEDASALAIPGSP
jgi:hypothetical protein